MPPFFLLWFLHIANMARCTYIFANLYILIRPLVYSGLSGRVNIILIIRWQPVLNFLFLIRFLTAFICTTCSRIAVCTTTLCISTSLRFFFIVYARFPVVPLSSVGSGVDAAALAVNDAERAVRKSSSVFIFFHLSLPDPVYPGRILIYPRVDIAIVYIAYLIYQTRQSGCF